MRGAAMPANDRAPVLYREYIEAQAAPGPWISGKRFAPPERCAAFGLFPEIGQADAPLALPQSAPGFRRAIRSISSRRSE
jgi:hypothetical protein